MPNTSRRLILTTLAGLVVAAAVTGGAALLASERPSGQLGISYALLAGFALAALLGLFLLVRLLARSAELERANAALRAGNRQLRAATEAKSRFLATVSHELKNPLGAMTGYAELLASGRWGRLSAAQLEPLGIIQAGGRHILALIEDLTDLARVEAGQVAVRPVKVRPRGVLEACVTLLSRLAETRDVTVAVRDGEDGEWLIDPTRLRQVILNYLSNAIKFTPAGGRVELRISKRDQGLLLEVADQGPGIAPADQARVFEEFFQVEGRSRNGSGLGLAVTRRIVEAQGGWVSLTSRPPAGSVFSACIPARPAPPGTRPQEPVAGPASERASRTIRRIPLSQRSG